MTKHLQRPACRPTLDIQLHSARWAGTCSLSLQAILGLLEVLQPLLASQTLPGLGPAPDCPAECKACRAAAWPEAAPYA